MTCPRGCCGSYREHVASIGMRPKPPAPKQTVDHTDTAIVTTTDHFTADRQDVHVELTASAVPNPNVDLASPSRGIHLHHEGDPA